MTCVATVLRGETRCEDIPKMDALSDSNLDSSVKVRGQRLLDCRSQIIQHATVLEDRSLDQWHRRIPQRQQISYLTAGPVLAAVRRWWLRRTPHDRINFLRFCVGSRDRGLGHMRCGVWIFGSFCVACRISQAMCEEGVGLLGMGFWDGRLCHVSCSLMVFTVDHSMQLSADGHPYVSHRCIYFGCFTFRYLSCRSGGRMLSCDFGGCTFIVYCARGQTFIRTIHRHTIHYHLDGICSTDPTAQTQLLLLTVTLQIYRLNLDRICTNGCPSSQSSALVSAFDMGWALTEQLSLLYDTLPPFRVHAEPMENRLKP